MPRSRVRPGLREAERIAQLWQCGDQSRACLLCFAGKETEV